VAFTYLKVKFVKCLCLLPVILVLVLVLLFWSWSWTCKQRSWSCYFGLGLKNLVLFTSLVTTVGLPVVGCCTEQALNRVRVMEAGG